MVILPPAVAKQSHQRFSLSSSCVHWLTFSSDFFLSYPYLIFLYVSLVLHSRLTLSLSPTLWYLEVKSEISVIRNDQPTVAMTLFFCPLTHSLLRGQTISSCNSWMFLETLLLWYSVIPLVLLKLFISSLPPHLTHGCWERGWWFWSFFNV